MQYADPMKRSDQDPAPSKPADLCQDATKDNPWPQYAYEAWKQRVAMGSNILKNGEKAFIFEQVLNHGVCLLSFCLSLSLSLGV